MDGTLSAFEAVRSASCGGWDFMGSDSDCFCEGWIKCEGTACVLRG